MKKKKIFALMAAALSLTACSTNDIADITHDDADNVVNVASVTRSGEGASTTSPMTAPFHLINITQATKRNVNFEADFTFNNNTNQYAQTGDSKVVWYNVKDADGNEIPNEFKAFSPIRTVANEASYTTFQILPDQSTPDKLAAADWMTATATSTKAAATDGLSLNFEHRNAKLHFNVTLKGDVAASALSSEIFKVLGAIMPYYNSTDNSKTIEAIVKPKDYSTSGTNLIELSIKMNDNTTEFLAAPFPSGLSELSPGKQYNFNLVIGHNAATISSVSVTDWNNSSIDLGGKDDAILDGYKVEVDPTTGVRTYTVSNYNAYKAWTQANGADNTNITLDGDITVPDGETLPYIDGFCGIFDGNGHTITTKLYNTNNGENGLLVGYNDGTIKNVKVNIDGGNNTLYGIAKVNNGTIEYCTIDGKVTAYDAFGICRINRGKIIACTNNADFSECNTSSAGISCYGLNYSGYRPTIIGCINNGNTKTAGITVEVGYHYNSDFPGTMISCVNTGSISDGDYALYNIFATGSTMKNCYWTSGNQSNYESNKASDSAGGQVTGGWTEEIINNLNTAKDGDNKSIQDYGYKFETDANGKLIIVPISSSSAAARR